MQRLAEVVKVVPGFNEEVKFYKRVTHEGGAIETEPTTLDEIMQMEIILFETALRAVRGAPRCARCRWYPRNPRNPPDGARARCARSPNPRHPALRAGRAARACRRLGPVTNPEFKGGIWSCPRIICPPHKV